MTTDPKVGAPQVEDFEVAPGGPEVPLIRGNRFKL